MRLGILMFIPLLYGLIFHDFPNALLATIGTFAHIYVFNGTFTSRMRSVTFATLGLMLAMMLGTLTMTSPLLFGIFLLIFAVVPYYVFNTLNIPGPSSTFFIIAFSLSSVMPEDPEAFLSRGLIVGLGGLLGILLVYTESKIKGKKPENDAVREDFVHIQKLVQHFNNQSEFNDLTKTTVKVLTNSSEILNTTGSSLQKKSSDYQRLTLLHHIAEGIYSELLELNAKGHRPLPQDIIDMMDYMASRIIYPKQEHPKWRKQVDVPSRYQELVALIFKLEEILEAPIEQVSKKINLRSPRYRERLLYHLTPLSINFISSLRYSVIVGVAILIALLFDFERAYWIPLSAHTVLIGGTTVASIERGGARWIGTLVGVGIATLILSFHPNIIIIVLVMCLSGALTEIVIGANYALAMIAITTQVILLSGLAQGNLTVGIAVPRLLDTTVGILIAIIGVLLIGRRLASKNLPEIMGDVARIEAQIFHFVFSENAYDRQAFRTRDRLRLKLSIENMYAMYRHAYGELSSNQKRTQYFYPAMFLLEQINFQLTQLLYDSRCYYLDDDTMGKYLLAFENVAKHFDRGKHHQVVIDLPLLPYYAQIRRSLMQLQDIELYDYQNKRNPNLFAH
ncbi:FUSC family protein [Staphylococcus sp. H16/1A]|uniref:FUSC family protein n=2 Tax=Staphylococcus canis TaxID=2724942 RepID=A0ABS0TA65_9STAP|nr:FUSC family protein [Staphylococcus canis]MBI5975638.1 FUSC family protein [Staphylococcus canis]